MDYNYYYAWQFSAQIATLRVLSYGIRYGHLKADFYR
jgi:hypothetical protein